MAFEVTAFKARRRLLNTLYYICFWGGLLLMLLDMTTPFPTPVRGAYDIWWLLIILLGGYFYIAARRLPIKETLLIAKESAGVLTVPILCEKLWISPTTALRIFAELDRTDECIPLETIGERRVFFFPNLCNLRQPPFVQQGEGWVYQRPAIVPPSLTEIDEALENGSAIMRPNGIMGIDPERRRSRR